jgi:hypothetical protein
MSGMLLMKNKCAAFIIKQHLIKRRRRSLKNKALLDKTSLSNYCFFFPFAFSRLNDPSKLEIFSSHLLYQVLAISQFHPKRRFFNFIKMPLIF